MKKFTGKISEEKIYSKYEDFFGDIENVYNNLNTVHYLLDEGYISHTKLKNNTTVEDINMSLDVDLFETEDSLEHFVLNTLSEMETVGKKYYNKYKNEDLKENFSPEMNRNEVVFYGKYSGHGSIQKDSFEEALEFAKESKKDLYKEDDEVLDKTLYIGVESNDKVAVVYITKEYYDYIKTLPSDDVHLKFIECAEDYIEKGEIQICEY